MEVQKKQKEISLTGHIETKCTKVQDSTRWIKQITINIPSHNINCYSLTIIIIAF